MELLQARVRRSIILGSSLMKLSMRSIRLMGTSRAFNRREKNLESI